MKETKKKIHWKFLQSLSFGFRFLFLAGLLAEVDWLHSRLNLLARDFVVGTSICVKQVRLLPFFLFLIRDSFRVSHTQDEVVWRLLNACCVILFIFISVLDRNSTIDPTTYVKEQQGLDFDNLVVVYFWSFWSSVSVSDVLLSDGFFASWMNVFYFGVW